MSCKDCVHYEVCMDYTTLSESETAQKFDQAEKICDHFKPKSRFVEVVRCKDCMHWGGITFGFVCSKFSGIETKICMGADHFCSYGEKALKARERE